MIVQLSHKQYQAQIDTTGAWLIGFSSDEGDILFPRQVITYPDGSKKLRGGSHVCLPNFGPGGDSGLPQHGYGRIDEWSVDRRSDKGVALSLGEGRGAYASLYSQLTYHLDDEGLLMELTLINKGRESLVVAPGFHPYFNLKQQSASLEIGGIAYDINKITDAVVITQSSSSVHVGSSTFALRTEGLLEWVLWSDNPDSYVCIEPTSASFAFEKRTGYTLLRPDEEKRYSMSIALAL